MTDLVSAIARGSRVFAEPIAQAFASGNRTWLVELRRPSGQPDFNRDEGAFVKRTAETYYRGPARIFPSAETTREVGDEDVPFNVARATVDFFTPQVLDEDDVVVSGNSAHPDWQPRADDILVVMPDPQSAQDHLDDRVFEITGVNVGGYIATGWSLELVSAAPSRYGDTG